MKSFDHLSVHHSLSDDILNVIDVSTVNDILKVIDVSTVSEVLASIRRISHYSAALCMPSFSSRFHFVMKDSIYCRF